MTKIATRENFRVEVEPERPFYVRPKDEATSYQMICDGIAKEIRRHVDGIEHVLVRWDVAEKCAHCGSRWTEGDALYNGGCCDKDCDEEDVRQALLTGSQS